MTLLEFTKMMSRAGMTVVARPADPFETFLRREAKKYARVIKTAGAKLQGQTRAQHD